MDGKLSIDQILTISPKLDPDIIRDFFERLPDRYFNQLTAKEVAIDAGHIQNAALTGSVEVDFRKAEGNAATCVVYAADYPGIFSLITGLLSATGFNIEAGSIFTYSRKTVESPIMQGRGNQRRNATYLREMPRFIIDRFTGSVRTDLSANQWQQDFSSALRAAFTPENIDSVRKLVYETVARALEERSIDSAKILYPVNIEIATGFPGFTRLTVVSEDTPFFLFAVSNALALNHLSIESVRIRTLGLRIEDEIDICDLAGGAVTDETRLNQIQLSILLTKQFTYFLGTAPDPYSALVRFEAISKDLTAFPKDDTWDKLLSNPVLMQDLAKVLGASDFLWEDFIRIQYENILPLIDKSIGEKHLSQDSKALSSKLSGLLRRAITIEEKSKVLNDFKNHEIYLIDLDHIVRPDADFLFLSRKLTALAEIVVRTAVELSVGQMTNRYGIPRTFAGIEARYAILGLGKMGGVALGYASDIELMLIYSDNGSTDGDEPIGNAEYFERMFKSAVNMIEAKREGIFHIDLRLRPYGNAGPTACSLESFCEYYGPDGRAHSYERLALIRMRAFGGERDLGARIERLRDDMVYRAGSIDLGDLRSLREKQLMQKTSRRQLNAKFSPGGLVDLEYSVQIIQCRYGKDNPLLRTPRIHVALAELVRAGHMAGEEAKEIVASYHYLRKVINGLRMLRGSARDLFLPPVDSDEYMHLARRAGYRSEEGLSSAQRLHMEFETRTAAVRSFIESHLGRDSIPGPPAGNVADIVLAENLPGTLVNKIFVDGGFLNPERGLRNLQALRSGNRKLFASLAVLAWDILQSTPDPDMALNNWERFVHALPSKEEHYKQLLAQPLKLEILLDIFAGSQFLADTLVGNPEFLDWVARPDLIHAIRKREDILIELNTGSDAAVERKDWLADRLADWLALLRTLRKREVLRIGTRDICLNVPFEDVVTELTNLADAIIQASLERIWKNRERHVDNNLSPALSLSESRFCVFAFGKLGGREINYSSDIDLLALFDGELYRENTEVRLSKVMETLRSYLSDYTADGFVYRVDFRLRPYGRASLLSHSLKSLEQYYRSSSSIWEHQALIKLRPVAGDLAFGKKVVRRLRHDFTKKWNPREISDSILHLRKTAASRRSILRKGRDVKSGEGGIRDIEFLVQGLQMAHAHENPSLVNENTLEAIQLLLHSGHLEQKVAEDLESDYRYLRKIEHFLQLLNDQQVHTLPDDEKALIALGKRIDGANGRRFSKNVENTMHRVHQYYVSLLPG